MRSPIAVVIGTGDPPEGLHEGFEVIRVDEGCSSDDAIARLVGRRGVGAVFLHGAWESLISRDTLASVWRACLSKAAVPPRLVAEADAVMQLLRKEGV